MKIIATYCIAIKKEANARHKNDYPLETLSIDGLVDLTISSGAVLQSKGTSQSEAFSKNSLVDTCLLMFEVLCTIGGIQPNAPLAHPLSRPPCQEDTSNDGTEASAGAIEVVADRNLARFFFLLPTHILQCLSVLRLREDVAS